MSRLSIYWVNPGTRCRGREAQTKTLHSRPVQGQVPKRGFPERYAKKRVGRVQPRRTNANLGVPAYLKEEQGGLGWTIFQEKSKTEKKGRGGRIRIDGTTRGGDGGGKKSFDNTTRRAWFFDLEWFLTVLLGEKRERVTVAPYHFELG